MPHDRIRTLLFDPIGAHNQTRAAPKLCMMSKKARSMV
jgi:hypothetical protein